MLNIRHRHSGVVNAVIDDSVDRYRDTVPGQNLLECSLLVSFCVLCYKITTITNACTGN